MSASPPPLRQRNFLPSRPVERDDNRYRPQYEYSPPPRSYSPPLRRYSPPPRRYSPPPSRRYEDPPRRGASPPRRPYPPPGRYDRSPPRRPRSRSPIRPIDTYRRIDPPAVPLYRDVPSQGDEIIQGRNSPVIADKMERTRVLQQRNGTADTEQPQPPRLEAASGIWERGRDVNQLPVSTCRSFPNEVRLSRQPEPSTTRGQDHSMPSENVIFIGIDDELEEDDVGNAHERG